jgi:hypothetical protein
MPIESAAKEAPTVTTEVISEVTPEVTPEAESVILSEEQKINDRINELKNQLENYKIFPENRLAIEKEINDLVAQKNQKEVKVEAEVKPEEVVTEEAIVEQPVEEAPKEEPKSLDEYVGKQVTLKDGTKGTVTKWEGGAGVTVKLDKGGSKLINPSEFKEVKEKPVPLPEEVQTVTENEPAGSYDDATEVKPEPVVEEEVVVEVEVPEKELNTRKNEIIKSTNKKNLKDIFDILEREGLLERDPNNTKDCI